MLPGDALKEIYRNRSETRILSPLNGLGNYICSRKIDTERKMNHSFVSDAL